MSRSTKLIVLTAPFTEMIDHAGYFIQMGMASIPIWVEGVLNRKYPEWKNVKRFEDGSAKAVPAGLRVLERVMMREFGRDHVVVCYPDDVDQFIGPETRVVAVSTHNPLGVTFAAGDLDLRQLARADQRSLREEDVPAALAEPSSAPL